MRLSYIGHLLSFISYGTVLVDAIAIPARMSKTTSVNSTNSTHVELRKIDWSVSKGGLDASRDVILAASSSVPAIATVLGLVRKDNAKNSCAPIKASGESNNGQQKYNFKYWVTTTGKNCDTTAETKTVAAALDGAWNQVHKDKYNWACIKLSHGGTWHGHLAVATIGSRKNINTMCN
ncbi:hypothetical protein N7478_004470 [Penicillium angulare]|uniref:uncharacterized protein n=1 Tax=Penicillium angulare TaxID=116970 RepID=UPI002540EC0F|nr:uncharacterized protein N7478_004470 [Penicillium angulare]KAJ5279098.1 hypothetical protein N7478_004470 [Penicillium angulare]